MMSVSYYAGCDLMPDIGIYKNTKDILKRYNIFPDKRLGQNFMIDPFIISKIIKSANITEKECIVEIGSGIGALTEQLALNAGKVISVEIDKRFYTVLKEELKNFDNIVFINNDILKTDLSEIISDEKKNGYNIKVVANLPYYITTPIIMFLLENELDIDSITIMIQKEVAERITAKPGTKNYGALTLAVNYYSKTSIVADVPMNCFFPRPTVDSAVIKLEILKKPLVNCNDKQLLFKLIRASFSQRRKTLVNAIFNQCGFNIEKNKIADILKDLGYNENIRGETIDLAGFSNIANYISEKAL